MKRNVPISINLAVAALISIFFFGCKILQKPITSNDTHGLSLAVKNPYFLFLSDVHLDVQRKFTVMGEDTGTDLWNNCKKKIDSLVNSVNPPAFVLYTGDMPVHYQCDKDKNCFLPTLPDSLTVQHASSIKAVLKGFSDLVATSKIPFLYVPGNNDALDGNYYSFSSHDYPAYPFSLINEPSYPYQPFHISKLPIADGAYMISDSNVWAGYYTAKVMKGLRMICLNTVIWGTTFRGMDENGHKKMGDDEMVWLKNQLAEAKDSGDNVYLAMHIPPGIDAYAKTDMWKTFDREQPWQNTFLSLMNRYRQIVAGIFYGHTHFDELRLFYDTPDNTPIQVAISCPGISTEHKNNPAFKTVNFDPVNKIPMDFTTYYSNPQANSWGDSTYTFSSVFNAKDRNSIYKTLRKMKMKYIEKDMNLIYTAKSNFLFNDSKAGIKVKPIPIKP